MSKHSTTPTFDVMLADSFGEDRFGRKADEAAYEYLQRLVANCGYETGAYLDALPSVQAVCEFFGLWVTYDTDLWAGVLEQINEGADPEPAFAFCERYDLKDFASEIVKAIPVAEEATP